MKWAMLSAGGLALLAGMSIGQIFAQDQISFAPGYAPAQVSAYPSAYPSGYDLPKESPYTSAYASPYVPAHGSSYASAYPLNHELPKVRPANYQYSEPPPKPFHPTWDSAPPYPTTFAPVDPNWASGETGNAVADSQADIPLSWTVTAGAVLLNRAGPAAHARMLVQDFLSGDERIDAKDIQVGMGAGARIDAIYHFAPSWDVELLYFGVNNWNQGRSTSSLGLFVPAFSGQYLVDNVTSRYRSDLNSIELNLRREIIPRITMLMGFRYLDLDDAAGLAGNSSLGTADASSQLTNNLYGFQLGADVNLLDRGGPFRINSFVKAGIYGDQISRSQTKIGTGVFSSSAFHDTGTHATLAGEAAVLATCELSQHLGLFGGYKAMWLAGVATAPEDIGSTAPIDAGFTVFYQGLLAGFDVKW